jgi:hypothetical protein
MFSLDGRCIYIQKSKGDWHKFWKERGDSQSISSLLSPLIWIRLEGVRPGIFGMPTLDMSIIGN